MHRFRWLCIGWVIFAVGCASVETVQPATVYRAERLSGAKLESAVKDNRIRTVVNVRGFEPEASWYREQHEICDKLGVEQVDVTLASREPNREEVIRLLEAFRSKQAPILITGDTTSGRVAFASGLYRVAILKQPKEEARKEMPFWRSHRMPGTELGGYGRFLQDWRSEEDFYAKYKLPPPRDGLPPTEMLLGQGAPPPVSGSERASIKLQTPRRASDRQKVGNQQDSRPTVRLGTPVGLSSAIGASR